MAGAFQLLTGFASRIPSTQLEATPSRVARFGRLRRREFSQVLNYLTLDDRLPAVFKPVSVRSHQSVGAEFLAWLIECNSAEFLPPDAAAILADRLSKPVEDASQWTINQSE